MYTDLAVLGLTATCGNGSSALLSAAHDPILLLRNLHGNGSYRDKLYTSTTTRLLFSRNLSSPITRSLRSFSKKTDLLNAPAK